MIYLDIERLMDKHDLLEYDFGELSPDAFGEDAAKAEELLCAIDELMYLQQKE